MEHPFRYPKRKHLRQLSPDDGRPYRSYKTELRYEFRAKCVYCAMPDSLRGSEHFGVDHYKPRSLFPDHERLYLNLYYACNPCNRRKGPFWPSDEEAERGLFVPNPGDHVMFDHVKFDAEQVVGRTAAGRFFVDLLDLNDPSVVEYRQNVIGLIRLAKEKLAMLECQEAKARRDANDDASSGDRACDEVRRNKRKVQEHLAFLTGAVLHS